MWHFCHTSPGWTMSATDGLKCRMFLYFHKPDFNCCVIECLRHEQYFPYVMNKITKPLPLSYLWTLKTYANMALSLTLPAMTKSNIPYHPVRCAMRPRSFKLSENVSHTQPL